MSKSLYALVAALSEDDLRKAYREFYEYDHSEYKHPSFREGGIVLQVMRSANLIYQTQYVREVFFAEMAKRHYKE